MDKLAQTRKTYNEIGADWHNDHFNDDWWYESTDTFLSFLPEHASILDVGCGGGRKSAYFVERGYSVVGIDFSSSFIDIARKEVPDARFIELDMLEADTLDESFDGIFAQASLLHIPKDRIQGVVSSLANKLKEDGYLYIAVKHHRDTEPDEQVIQEKDYGYAYTRFFSFFTVDEVESYMKFAGLEIVHSSTLHKGSTVWIQVIAKLS